MKKILVICLGLLVIAGGLIFGAWYRQFHAQIASFSTVFNFGELRRNTNIGLAAHKIDGIVLKPGEIFSFNEVVGKRGLGEGYQKAGVLVPGTKVQAIGGGVCQVAGTLYNLALLAGLEIIERHAHSQIVKYVGLGRDATVSYPNLDLKFKNINLYPITLRAQISGDLLTFKAIGYRRSGYTIKLVEANREVVLPNVVVHEDDELSGDEWRFEQRGKSGYRVSIFRVVEINGEEIRRELISEDTYNPISSIIEVGDDRSAE